MNSPIDDAAAAGSPALRAHLTLALLMLVAVFAYSNLQLFSLLANDIKTSFGLSDTSLGILQGLTVNLSTAITLIPVGMLVDRINRIRLLMGAAALWGLFTLLTGFSETFWQMFACRVGVGIAEAAVYPAAYSLIADLYAPRHRALAVPIFLTGTLAGASALTALSGMLIGSIAAAAAAGHGGIWALPGWRLAFAAAAIPGFVLCVALAAVREPPRRENHAEAAAGTAARTANDEATSFLAFFAGQRGLLICLIGAIVLSQLGLAPIFGWLPAAFIRMFGFTPARTGQWFGTLFGIGSLSGVAIGTSLVSLLGRRDPVNAPLKVLKIGVALAAVAVIALPFGQSPLAIAVAVTVFITAVYVGMTVTPTILIAVAPNHLRGRLIALETLSLIGMMAITPPLVGVLSDHVFKSANGLILGVGLVTIPCSLLAPLLLSRVRRLNEDRK